MALYKPMKLENGIVLNYHRILYVTLTTNQQNSIAVVSYLTEQAREEEKSGTVNQPYQEAVTYETTYNPDMTIENAYKYLMTLPEYEDAKEI